jgi:FAD/FMN-containing dehydrogenase
MSSKVAQYLQQHIVGEVMTSDDALNYFSTDGSIFQVKPKVVVYPRNTSDVRKVARFAWQLAERGRVMPITARGKGTDQAGAALGEGIMMVFPAHMNKILELDRESVTVQPGIIYGKLEQTLHTHGRFLPPYPSSIEFSTIGGAIGNNAAGEKSIKYGAMREFAKSVNVVLANGELISTKRLSKRELSKKKGLTNFEGEIYRSLDALITDNWDTIQNFKLAVSKNSAGYALADVKRKDGTFDLTPLMVGSQGTLGIVTQAVLKTEAYNPKTTLMAAYFDDINKADEAVNKIIPLKPSACEFIDEHLLNFLDKNNPHQLSGLVSKPYPKIIVLVEFDDLTERNQKKNVRKCKKILAEMAYEFSMTTDEHEKENLWKIRHSAAAVIWHSTGRAKALPIIEDGIVPQARFVEYMNHVYTIFKKYNLDVAVWGHAGNANIHMQPFLDLGNPADRQKVFAVANEYYEMVISLGGSTSGEHSDGRLRGPYLPRLLGADLYGVYAKVKQIFDPYGMLNPEVKIGVDQKKLPGIMRKEYSMEHLYDHMPRS